MTWLLLLGMFWWTGWANLGEFHTVPFVCSHLLNPSSLLSAPCLHPFPPEFEVSSFPQSSPVCVTQLVLGVGFALEYPGHLIKEKWLSNSLELSYGICSLARGIVPPSPLHAVILSGLHLPRSYAHCHNHCGFMCAATLLCPESTTLFLWKKRKWVFPQVLKMHLNEVIVGSWGAGIGKRIIKFMVWIFK